MEFKEFVKQFDRMCNYYPGCDNCPMSRHEADRDSCTTWCFDHPIAAENLVSEFKRLNPPKTNGEKLLEVIKSTFPNVRITGSETGRKGLVFPDEWWGEEYDQPEGGDA